jgi:uncharacterized protein YecE (DUF72 family)
MEHEVRIGPAGWSYDDWKGIVYPAGAKSKFDQLHYLANYFDTIEINSTFYRPPSPSASKSWARRVSQNSRFRFTAKLYQRFTHERGASTAEDEKSYRAGIDPLAEAGRLGAILIQFPWSFKNTDEERLHLNHLINRFSDYPLVVELRHASWNQRDVYDWLQEQGVGFCNIDQPIFSRSIKPSALATSQVGYIRLHGRNYKSWFTRLGDKPEERAERYNYLYSPEELEPWLDKIRHVAEYARGTYVITNNHFRGKGIVNALEMKAELEGKKVPAPPTLLKEYPIVGEYVVPEERT